MPGINDNPKQIATIVDTAVGAGAESVDALPLHLRGSTKDIFLAWLRDTHPALLDQYEQLYGEGTEIERSEHQRLIGLVRPRGRTWDQRIREREHTNVADPDPDATNDPEQQIPLFRPNSDLGASVCELRRLAVAIASNLPTRRMIRRRTPSGQSTALTGVDASRSSSRPQPKQKHPRRRPPDLLLVRCASIGTAAESALNTREQSRASRRWYCCLSVPKQQTPSVWRGCHWFRGCALGGHQRLGVGCELRLSEAVPSGSLPVGRKPPG
jgi:hypothetical protein